MPIRDVIATIEEIISPVLRMLEDNALLRWGLAGLLWVVIVFRLFGRGPGQRHGLFNWYDWLVVLGGIAALWALRFGAHLPWQ